MTRQQIRQEARMLDREARVTHAIEVAAAYAVTETRGRNRAERRGHWDRDVTWLMTRGRRLWKL